MCRRRWTRNLRFALRFTVQGGSGFRAIGYRVLEAVKTWLRGFASRAGNQAQRGDDGALDFGAHLI